MVILGDCLDHLKKYKDSTDLVMKLLDMYGVKAKAAIKWGCRYIGSEISQKQIECFNDNKRYKALP